MSSLKIAVTLDADLLPKLDRFAAQRHLPDRAAAVQEALRERFRSPDGDRLARESAKLDPQEEQRTAEGEPGLEEREAVAGRIDALHARLSAKYGTPSDSVPLLREDRDR